jgi:ribosomal protein S18 acetylase RimI-like enzyme
MFDLKLAIREYMASDRPCIVKCMEELQDYLVKVDGMKFTRRMPEYGEHFTEKLLQEVRDKKGRIYVAEDQGKIAGFIAGIVYEWSTEVLLECVPLKSGRILELFVDLEHRRQGIGRMLMRKIEEYFRISGCDVFRVEVFKPNTEAYQFYQGLGYQDRIVDMIKKR